MCQLSNFVCTIFAAQWKVCINSGHGSASNKLYFGLLSDMLLSAASNIHRSLYKMPEIFVPVEPRLDLLDRFLAKLSV